MDMDMSSPLAALRPQPMLHWGCSRGVAPPTKPLFGALPTNLSFNAAMRDLSFSPPDKGYLSARPMRGSSPTASLAADMSSNLRVDASSSPQFATPRRSLFTLKQGQLVEHCGITTPPVRWEHGTTPTIPSSSPSCAPDSMDISPLPHKPPFLVAAYRPSPTPEPTPSDDAMLPLDDTHSLPRRDPPRFDGPGPVSAADRRRPILPRPSLGRTKNWSTNSVPFKSKENAPFLPFAFVAGSDAPPSAPLPLDCLAASPPADPKTVASPAMPLPRPKLTNINTNLPRTAGLATANVRKPAGPPTRRPSKFRRSLSMYEHPADVIHTRPETPACAASSVLQSVMDMDPPSKLQLPHFHAQNDQDGIPRVSHQTLVDVLNGNYAHYFDKVVVVDCRFEYEYSGGHIEGAINFCEKESLAHELFQCGPASRTLLVFHCEYSVHRAPLMAKFVRNEDRKANVHRYPVLTFPEVYIMDGGYSQFYESHRHRCYPQNYLKMDDKGHENACERGLDKLRQRGKINRAQTYAFGQNAAATESPVPADRARTACAPNLRGEFPFPLYAEPASAFSPLDASRRMTSY